MDRISPPDATLRTWLLSVADPSMSEKVVQQLHAFVYALLDAMRDRLASITSESVDFPPIALPTIY